MKKVFLIAVLLVLAVVVSSSYAGSNGFTQKDRETLIELKATLNTFMKQVDKRFEQIDKRFEQIDKRIDDFRQDVNKRFEEVDKRFEGVYKRFEEMDKRFDQMMNFLWILTTIFITITTTVIGFAYWDRRTIIRKAKEDTIEYLEREGKLHKLIEALKELAKEDEKLAKILRMYGLM